MLNVGLVKLFLSNNDMTAKLSVTVWYVAYNCFHYGSYSFVIIMFIVKGRLSYHCQFLQLLSRGPGRMHPAVARSLSVKCLMIFWGGLFSRDMFFFLCFLFN